MDRNYLSVENVPITMARSRDNESCLKSIEAELSLGRTFVTVALLAYHMGQPERGDRARARAQEAQTEARKLMASYPGESTEAISAEAEELDALLKEAFSGKTSFGPLLYQHSMS